MNDRPIAVRIDRLVLPKGADRDFGDKLAAALKSGREGLPAKGKAGAAAQAILSRLPGRKP
ncbi:hypothetical protein RGQ15_21515 [Paracoccus sp. MBLB3053]|uniref:Uncharacterized protein n=1 Tax=Paracoccus aurantius TaxID=3073814 RepID=A0ABU2I004_9RHOB|nr:hypothetical protein [Paracoccus sp. MBLB3053]MDS9470135.1 hypothetical protein [Paracoccus sp. MBLB3053]